MADADGCVTSMKFVADFRTREITIDAAEAFYRSIVEATPYSMAYEEKREATSDELLRTSGSHACRGCAFTESPERGMLYSTP